MCPQVGAATSSGEGRGRAMLLPRQEQYKQARGQQFPDTDPTTANQVRPHSHRNQSEKNPSTHTHTAHTSTHALVESSPLLKEKGPK